MLRCFPGLKLLHLTQRQVESPLEEGYRLANKTTYIFWTHNWVRQLRNQRGKDASERLGLGMDGIPSADNQGWHQANSETGCIICLLDLENIENNVEEANQPNLIDIPIENTSIRI